MAPSDIPINTAVMTRVERAHYNPESCQWVWPNGLWHDFGPDYLHSYDRIHALLAAHAEYVEVGLSPRTRLWTVTINVYQGEGKGWASFSESAPDLRRATCLAFLAANPDDSLLRQAAADGCQEAIDTLAAMPLLSS